MKLRVRLNSVELDLGYEKRSVGTTADTVFELPCDPVATDKRFLGKFFISHTYDEVVVKWGFSGVVRSLQQKLIDDPELASASFLFNTSSSPTEHTELFEAFLNGREIPMLCQPMLIVER